jgi:hypothetical protein
MKKMVPLHSASAPFHATLCHPSAQTKVASSRVSHYTVTLYCHITSSNNDSTHYTVHYAIVRHQGGRCRSSWLQYAPRDKHCNRRNSLSCSMKICNAAYSNRDVSAHGNNAQRTRAHENNVRTTHGEHAHRTENSGQRTGPRTADSEQDREQRTADSEQANSRIVRQGDTTGTTSGFYGQEEHEWYYNDICRTL